MLGTLRSGIAIAGLVLAGGPPALAQPAGTFVVVQNELSRTAKSGGRVAVGSGQDLVVGELYRSSGASAAKLLLRGDTLVSIGEETEFRIEADGTRASLELSRGRLRAFTSPFAEVPGRIEIQTASLLLEVLDSEVLVEVLGDGSCVVTAISGSPVGRIPARPDAVVRLIGGQQTRLSAAGELDVPRRLDHEELDELWASVEAMPPAPRALPSRLLRQWAAPTRSGGERLAMDCISCPDRRTFDGRGVDPGPGAAAVTSGSKSGTASER